MVVVTVTDAPNASVIGPAEVNVRLSAVLTPRISSTQLSGVSTADSLTLTSAGPITEALGASVTVTTTTVLIAGAANDIVLGSLTNDFIGDVMDVQGKNVTLTDANGIQLPAGAQILGSVSTTLNVGAANAGSSSFLRGTIQTGVVTTKVQVNGGAGNDTVTIDLTTASLPDGLTFNGGGGSDSFVINGTSGNDYINIIDGPTGVIKRDNNELLNYQSVEDLFVNTFAGNDQVVFQMAVVPTTVLHMDGGGGISGSGIRDGLQIIGTNGNDVAVVGNYSASNVYTLPAYVMLPAFIKIVPHNRQLPCGFKVENIQTLQIFGGAGNDILVNNVTKGGLNVNSGVPSLLNGGAGSDLLIGGNFRNVIFGGAGKDCLYGGTAKDYIFADHDFLIRDTNGLPKAFKSDGDVVRGRGGADVIVALGKDTVDSGGKGATIVGTGLGLSVYDWLQARRPQFTTHNINLQLNAALKLYYASYTEFFKYGLTPM